MEIYNVLKIMSSENKAKIIAKFLYCNNCDKKTVGSLCSQISIKQSCLSKHLMELRKLGIISNKKSGREVFYTINNNFENKWGKLIKNIINNNEDLKNNYCGCLENKQEN